MHRVFAPRNGLAAGIVLTLALMPAARAAAPGTPEVQAKEATPAEKIRKQLDQPITIEINDQSLNAALNLIREQTKINFVVDRFTIQQMGMDPEQMLVNIKLKEVKARSCLRSVLGPYNLGYAIIGDTVLISTDDMAMHRQLRQRVSVDLEKMDLAAALKKLSRDTATNVMLDTRVTGKETKAEVTLQMEDVPLETAVRLMAEMAGLKPVKVGNVLFVTTKAHANEIRAEGDLNQPGVTAATGYAIDGTSNTIKLIEQPVPAPPQPPTTPPAPPAEKVGPDKPADKEEKADKPAAPAKPDKP
jgi:hypothetical protein